MKTDRLTQALESLPHGPGFRFVDRLLDLKPGSEGTGEYRVRGDEPFLAGHFPGAPIFPGVLLVEAVAQLAGTVAQSDPQHPPLPGLKLTAVRNARIHGTAKPGEVIRMEARVTGRLGNLIQAEGSAHVGGVTILQTQLTLSGEVMPA